MESTSDYEAAIRAAYQAQIGGMFATLVDNLETANVQKASKEEIVARFHRGKAVADEALIIALGEKSDGTTEDKTTGG